MPTVKATVIIDRSKPLDAKAIERALIDGLDKAAATVEKDYNSTTVTWRHRSRASIDKPNQGERVIGMDDPIWKFVDEGTSPHNIGPRRAKKLAFNSSFTPKTKPGVLGSGAGFSGGSKIFSGEVRHPGSKARGFSKLIGDRADQVMDRLVDDILEKFDL